MATVIQFKRSSTQNDVTPSVSDLSLGEVAINLIMVECIPRKMMGQQQS